MLKKIMLVPFLIALSLLTRLPVTYFFKSRYLSEPWSDKQQGLSPLFYPAVGLLLAGLLYIFLLFVHATVSPIIMAALIVITWVALTGALHLDGLADSVDAAFFSHHIVIEEKQYDEETQRENIDRILTVFKDPAAGPMAVVALIFTLLLKTLLVYELMLDSVEQFGIILAMSLVLARTLAVMLMMSTPYVSTNGLGAALVVNLPKGPAVMLVFLVACSCFVFLPFFAVCSLLFVLGLLFFFWRRFWLRRIGGFVGDCVGGLIELAELCVLFILYLVVL